MKYIATIFEHNFYTYFFRKCYEEVDLKKVIIIFLNLQSWTLISRLFRNVAEKCFSANVPKVLIFGLLIRTGTINDFSC